MTIATRVTLLGLGLAFLVTAVLIVGKQRKAASCPVHNRRAGRIAVLLSGFCCVVGLTLLVTATIF